VRFHYDLLGCVVFWLYTNVLEELTASIFRVKPRKVGVQQEDYTSQNPWRLQSKNKEIISHVKESEEGILIIVS
jgi:hypothetical protein